MEIAKRESKNGIIQLASNVKAAYNTVDRGLLEDVAPDDLDYMILVINYCSTTIGRKSDDIQIYIVPAYHELSKEVILYTLYVALPMKTVIEDEQFFYIRSISPRRINRAILYEHDTKANLMRLQLCINPMKYMPEVEEMSIVNIHLKLRRVNYYTEKDDDKRGSTKRTRTDAVINK